MKRRYIMVAVTAILFTTMTMAPCAVAWGDDDSVVSVDDGETYTVSETTSLSQLTIGEDATVTAQEGYSLTLTVDGVETPIAPGVYQGSVVLTPTEDITVSFTDMGLDDTYYYRSAIYVNDGEVVPEKSVAAAVIGGNVTDDTAEYVMIRSVGDEFNGIVVDGDSEYTVLNPAIHFIGNGGNDFTGFGAAIMAQGNADLVIDRARIMTEGVIRTAVWAGENSTIEVNNSYIEARDGTLPDDYLGGPLGGGGVMMEVPWVLGITGNCRATNALGNATAYYNNSYIKAQAWGALSTDSVQDVKLYATNCRIDVVESGYGAYADGSSLGTFSGCRMNVPDMGLIMTQGSGVFTDGSVVNSGRFGVMMHGGGSGSLTIDGRSVFNTGEAVIQVKGNYPTIVVDDAVLHSRSGVILESFANDDPNGGPGAGVGGVDEMPGEMPGEMPDDMPDDMTGEMPEGNPDDQSETSAKAVTASFSNTRLRGDIINGNTADSDIIVSFENAVIKGAITTAATQPLAEDLTMDDADQYYLIGEVEHTYGPPADDDLYGLVATLDENSGWIVTETSYLTGLNIAEGAVISAPPCGSLSMTVDGVETELEAGAYEGEIVLEVTETDYCPKPGRHYWNVGHFYK
ncbi:MAG: hypothetical protein PVI60_12160 [Desulfobacteraceae bacterium]|jgi:hypothetical protein